MSSKLYAEAKKREGAIANFLKDVASIPSLSSQEGDVVKFMAAAMKKMGYDEVVIDGMGNLLGRIGNDLADGSPPVPDGPQDCGLAGFSMSLQLGNPSQAVAYRPAVSGQIAA